MQHLHLLLLPLVLLLSTNTAHATGFDIWGIEIQAEQTGPLSVDAAIVLYVKRTGPADSFRDTLILSWGDGTSSSLPIFNDDDNDGDGIPDGSPVEGNFVKYIYSGSHTYVALDRYLLSVTNPNREAGLMNVNFPNSVSVRLYTESEILLIEDYEHNRLPVLLEPPVNYAFENQPYLHLPNAFDLDDDSLVYELVVPKQDVDSPVPNYFGIGALATIDSETGIFDALITQSGAYAFAIQVSSYRNGELMDRVVRDMKFNVEEAPTVNDWPTINVNTPLIDIQEVNVGDTVRFEAEIEDDISTMPIATSSSGLYDYFMGPAEYTLADNILSFVWIVTEEHIRTQPYSVVIKVKDDYLNLGYDNFALVRYRIGNGTTAVENIIADETFTVFPNPATGFLKVEMRPGAGVSKPLLYRVFSANGQLVKSGMLESNHSIISVKGFPSGSYFLEVLTNEKTLSIQQVIINE